MDNFRPPPLAYESKRDFKRHSRFVVKSARHWEVIQFTIWMLGLFVAGLVILVLYSLVR